MTIKCLRVGCDMKLPIEFIVYGEIPSQKNILRVSRTGHFFHANDEMAHYRQDFSRQCSSKAKLLLTEPVKVDMVIYAKNRRKDFHNMQSAIMDALQFAGIVKNDRIITEWHGKGFIDKNNPRVELEIREIK